MSRKRKTVAADRVVIPEWFAAMAAKIGLSPLELIKSKKKLSKDGYSKDNRITVQHLSISSYAYGGKIEWPEE